jgi:Ser/Thr protein kinase RdoA (MazF antagonist)
MAKEALKVYGMEGARLSFIQYFQNIIYRVETKDTVTHMSTDGAYTPGRYLLRIHAMDDVEATSSELTWLEALYREAGLSVPAPVPTLEGKLLTRIITPGLPRGRVVSLMRWLDGRRIHQGFKPKHLTALGKVVAQMHTFSASWQPPAGFSRPVWDWDSQLGGSMFERSLDELAYSMPGKFQQPFQVVSQTARQVMEGLGKGSDAFGLIHSDLYPENVLYKAGEALPIDFEDSGFGYWMWDIAIALNKWAWNEDWERMRDSFREGYVQVRVLPEGQWAQLDLFIAIQFATMLLWASEFLLNDPQRVVEYTPWRDDNGNKLLEYFSKCK